MSIYAIGDVQGCYAELEALLNQLAFKPNQDELWFVGDLVNRGPDSLAVLRFVKQLGEQAKVVLGNHDLHLLAIICGQRSLTANDTLQAVIEADDVTELYDWLRQQPLLHYDKKYNTVMTHAGLYPYWSLALAQQLSREIENQLQSKHCSQFLASLYAERSPRCWSSQLADYERYRFVINALTRMRYCNRAGCLDFDEVGPVGSQPEKLTPWFELPKYYDDSLQLVFGHWAALEGITGQSGIFALDTGCVWGKTLTAMRLEDKQRFTVKRMTHV